MGIEASRRHALYAAIDRLQKMAGFFLRQSIKPMTMRIDHTDPRAALPKPLDG